MIKKFMGAAFGAVAMLGTGHAALLSDLDLSGLSFDIDSQPSGNPVTITGTSNGIGFTFVGGNFAPFSSTANDTSYVGLPGSYDDIHTGTGTFTFDVPIQGLIFGTSNDSSQTVSLLMDGTVMDIAGSLQSIAGGVQYTASFTGGIGLIIFSQAVTSFSVLVSNPFDGVDFSVFALEDLGDPVPLPAAALLMVPGVLLLRRRTPRP